jgi:hypothetical protein
MLASFFTVGVGVFCLNQNETGIYLGLAMLALYILISGEKRLFSVFTMLSAISFLNISQMLNIGGAFAGLNSQTNFAAKDWLIITGGILAVAATIYFGWVAYDITINNKRKDIEPLYEKPWPAFKKWVNYLLGRETSEI